MLTFSNEDITAKIKEDLGVDTTGRDFLPFSDLEQSVHDDVETLRNSASSPTISPSPALSMMCIPGSSARSSEAEARRGRNGRGGVSAAWLLYLLTVTLS